jgi:heme oxygenase
LQPPRNCARRRKFFWGPYGRFVSTFEKHPEPLDEILEEGSLPAELPACFDARRTFAARLKRNALGQRSFGRSMIDE